MQEPLKLTIRNIQPQYKDDIETEVREWSDKLDKFYPRITTGRVVIELPHRRHREGNLYRVVITVSVPGKQIVVDREHPYNQIHENYRIAIRDAFEDAFRQLEEYDLVQSREIKAKDTEVPHGVITKLFPDGYGFIEEFGGREIYFHKNSVLDGFENLRIGMEVRFEEEAGEKGPQASTVKVLKKEHAHHRGL